MNTLTAVQTISAPNGVIRQGKKPYNESESLTPLTTIAANLDIHPRRHDFDESEYVEITLIALEELYTDKDYQRLIHIPFINEAKKFDPKLVRPLIVFKRPNGKHIVGDGQHVSVMGILYTNKKEKTKVPCHVHVHPSDYTTKQCVATEAEFFVKINFNRRNVGMLQRLRAGISYGDEYSILTEEKLIDMGVHLEGIGNSDGPEVYGLVKLLLAYEEYGISNTIKAIELYQKLQKDSSFPKWNDSKPLNAGLICGLAAIFHLKETALGKGDKNYALDCYLDDYLGKKNPKELCLHTTGDTQAILIARKIVDGCNNRIEDEVLVKHNNEPLMVQIREDVMDKAGLGDPGKSA